MCMPWPLHVTVRMDVQAVVKMAADPGNLALVALQMSTPSLYCYNYSICKIEGTFHHHSVQSQHQLHQLSIREIPFIPFAL